MQSLEAGWFKEHRVLPVDAEDITWNDLMTCSRKTHLEEYDGCGERYRLKDSEKRERERERAREQERERERDPDDGAMELRSAAMHFFFSHTLQIISPRVHSVKSCKHLPTHANAFAHKWI